VILRLLRDEAMATTSFDEDATTRVLSGVEEPSAITAVGERLVSFLVIEAADEASFVTEAAT
jgi:hypothetical protein